MAATINYYCSCMSPSPVPPPPHLPSSSSSFHPLHTLYFCEDCDAIRCNRCVSIEISGYYCPNCLFEVPSASVRAERNRCARNCFQCPHCRNTLSVVPSDPIGDVVPSAGTPGEPPFLLYCNNCRWDSAEVGISFEKPTGLAQQLQRSEDSAPELLEFERLKDFFEPLLRSSLSASQQGHTPLPHSTHHNAITAAASSALARDIPGVGKYHAPVRTRASKAARQGSKDDLPVYRSRVEASGASGLGAGGDGDTDFMRHLQSPAEVAKLEQRWSTSWADSLHSKDLKPIRIPLHSRLTKRCSLCRHIIIKPEQKAQSVRFKLKVVAANYLPAIRVTLPHVPAQARRLTSTISTQKDKDEEPSGTPMVAGKTYPFHLSLTNPLYDPIQVRLAVQRQQLQTSAAGPSSVAEDSGGTPAPRRPHFAVSLPSNSFGIAPYAEAWEYDDDEEMFGIEDEGGLGNVSPTKARGKSKTVGVLEKKANTTVVGGEVVISREGRGEVKFNMLVSYTYRSDEPQEDEGDPKSRNAAAVALAKSAPEMKTFSFYTVVHLGTIVPKEENS